MISAFFDVIFIFPITIASALWITMANYAEAPKPALILLSAGVALAGTLLLHLKRAGKIVLGGTLISIIILWLFIIPEETRTVFLTDHPWFLMCAGVSTAAFIIGIPGSKFRIPRLIFAVIAFGMVMASVTFNFQPEKPVVPLAFVYILATVIELIQSRWNKTGDTDGKKHLVFLSPFLILFMVIQLAIPTSDEPYGWDFVKDVYNTASDRLDRIVEFFERMDGGDSEDGFRGFSESAGIKQSNSENDKKVMEVTIGAGAPSVIYLKGKTFDSFDGREWTKTNEDDSSDPLIDTTETLSSIRKQSGYEKDYIREAEIKIRFLNVHSTHVFTPAKTMNIDTGTPEDVISPKGGDYTFEERKTYNDTYSVEFYKLNLGSRMMRDFLAEDHSGSNDGGAPTVIAGNALGIEAYRRKIKEVYLQPVEFSPKLQGFLDEFLADCTTNEEKLEKIEKLLSAMEYNTSPGAIPKDVDTSEEYLDYFIFEKQEGYCVHYATAFVLLARGLGIPARYVQGYTVTPRGGLTAIVTENDAHAWPEVYFEGPGWIQFEPTPGRSLSMTQTWKTSDIYEAERERDNATGFGQGSTGENEEDSEIILPEKIEEEHEEENSEAVKYVLIIFGISAAVALALFALNILLGLIAFKRADDARKFKMIMARNLHILAILGYKKPAAETFQEFKIKCSETIATESLSFIDDYELCLYRGDKPGREETKKALRCNEALVKYVKQQGISYRLSLLSYYLFGMYGG